MAICNPHNSFLIDFFRKTIDFFSKRELTASKNKLFITVFTIIYWVKPAWLADVSNLDITDGRLQATLTYNSFAKQKTIKQ